MARPKRVEVVGWPRDLRNWVSPTTILVWIESELNHIDWQSPALVDHLRGYPEYRPKPMLRLLSFAYAVGITNSKSIASACESNPVLHKLCDGPAPFAEELLSFQRKNSQVLESILEKLLLLALREKMDLQVSDLTTGLREAAREWAALRIRMAQPMESKQT